MENNLNIIKELINNNRFIFQLNINQIKYFIDSLDCSINHPLFHIYDFCKLLFTTKKDYKIRNLLLWNAFKCYSRLLFDDIDKLVKNCLDFKNLRYEDLGKIAKTLEWE